MADLKTQKENDAERNCNTCRFAIQNSSDGKAHCPEDETICDYDTGLHKWQPIPKEEPLKPPYVITDIPENEEIFIKVCEKTGKEWPATISHKDQFERCCRKKEFPVKIYVRSTLTYEKNAYISSSEPPTKIHYKDFLNTKEEDLKMKQVILEVPGKEVYIDVQWFKDNKDCGEGEKYFINRYGKDAKIKWNTHYHDLKQENNTAGLKFMNDHRPQQPEGDYVHINDVNKDKIYIYVGEDKLFKLQRTIDNKWSFCSLDDSFLLADGRSNGMKEEIIKAVSSHKKIYEFKTFNAFTKAYQEGKI
jgi:hypothetical protein